MNGTLLLAAISYGLARATRSTHGAWTVEGMLASLDVRCLAADPLSLNAIYAGTQAQGMLRAAFDPRQAGRVFAHRGVRLASLGYVGHMWDLFAMYAWFLTFFSDALRARGSARGSSPAYATFAMIATGGVGCWMGGMLGNRWGRTKTTALTLQLAVGFTITVATIWLIPLLENAVGWRWAFTCLAPGPLLGVLAMLRLKSLPEAARIANGKR